MTDNGSPRAFNWLTRQHVAHRGLYQAGTICEENTLPAIEAAINAGFSVEIDVRLTGDDRIAVFHDVSLDRLTGQKGLIAQHGLAQLQEIQVGNSGAGIPHFPDVLDLVDGRTPLFVEIKTEERTNIQHLCAGIRHSLEGYAGDVAVMSFDPRIGLWFSKYMPKYARGAIIGRDALLSISRRLTTALWIKRIQPDFIACDIHLLPNSLCNRWRKKGKPVLTWTVKNELDEIMGSRHADALIFERPAIVGP